jgi:hypothetical protein
MRSCLRVVGCALLFALASVLPASADYIVRPWNTDADWSSESPNRNAPELQECFGNCGAGCSDAWNPGCGGSQYWELQILSDLQPTGYRKGDFMCYGGTCYYYEYMRVQAMGRWTYHGYFSWGCLMHDSTCPEFLWGLGCLWFGGCGSGWNQDWSYDTVVLGWQPVYVWEIGPDS